MEALPLAFQYYCLEHGARKPASVGSVTAEKTVMAPENSDKTTSTPQKPGPRMKLKDLTWKNKALFNELMERHTFVVLTDLGERVEALYTDLRAAMQAFFEQDRACKDVCTSKYIYRNENKTPMWYAGYECTHVRECFRAHAGDLSRMQWPSADFEEKYLALVCQSICDKSLSLTLGYITDSAHAHQSAGEDLSVCYGLHYPNKVGTGQSNSENVFEHIDPSLYVIEPVTDVAGLDVFDPHSGQWLSVEQVCTPHKEWVLFCGKALTRATDGRVPGTLHRVTRPDHTRDISRYCFIYEQKYQPYF
ncbi:hypothetical protein DYB32_001656 [Aphanomyces invadans]|uniref:Isopenicillin N synthase-like Fe(2+) 2OG dioxygenase domain-containing protein n=1 Tax=Aphanomyces invadans TaxID=157072 RepID=A0A3R7ADS4_9STRA|nr:hypothetical protein DYB32_001656 [Aphanomyces invadans]